MPLILDNKSYMSSFLCCTSLTSVTVSLLVGVFIPLTPLPRLALQTHIQYELTGILTLLIGGLLSMDYVHFQEWQTAYMRWGFCSGWLILILMTLMPGGEPARSHRLCVSYAVTSTKPALCVPSSYRLSTNEVLPNS